MKTTNLAFLFSRKFLLLTNYINFQRSIFQSNFIFIGLMLSRCMSSNIVFFQSLIYSSLMYMYVQILFSKLF